MCFLGENKDYLVTIGSDEDNKRQLCLWDLRKHEEFV